MDSIRQQKINSLLKKELALIFQQESMNLFHGLFITVTQVRITSDLGLAKIYLSFLMADDKPGQLEKVKQHASGVRRLLGNRVGKQLRVVPQLAFFMDDSLDYYEDIDRLLKD